MRFPEDVPVLTDGVVTLRAHVPADADGVWEQCADPVSRHWTTVPVPYSHADATAFVTEHVPGTWRDGSAWSFAVEADDEAGRPRFCGTVDLRDHGNRRAEIAYGSHPWARGRGVMDRALRLLLTWGFEQQRLRAVIWWANVGNWASRRAAWRLGFSCDGTVRRWLSQRGDLLDGWVGVLHVDEPRQPRTTWLTAPRLGGHRVALRAFREQDDPRIVEACTDPRTMHWLAAMPSPYTVQDAHDYRQSRIEQQAQGVGVAWAVADPASDELVGSIALFDLRPGRDAEIGYWTHPDARGRGVMTEACHLVVRHAFSPAETQGLGLGRLTVAAAVGNTASQRVIAANGFTRVGHERRSERLGDGQLVDLLRYDRLADDAGDEEAAGQG